MSTNHEALVPHVFLYSDNNHKALLTKYEEMRPERPLVEL